VSPRVVVVGASGPLGQAVASGLHRAGHDVTAASRSSAERLDATDLDSVRRMLQESKPESLIYLARPNLEASDNLVKAVDDAVDAFRSFVDASATYGVKRLLLASSAAVYGTDEQLPRGETAKLLSDSPYADLKVRFEMVLEDARSTIAGTSFRIFNVYGSGFESSLVNRLVTGSTPPPVVFDTESFVRDYIHGADVARLFRMAVEADLLPTPVVNVGTGVGTSNRALLSLLENAPAGLPKTEVASFSVADTSLLRKEWGFTAEISLSSAVKRPQLFTA
jgi:UDP-glucose 4-epimerase